MQYEFHGKDYEDSREITVSQEDVEYLGDVLELFLSFLQGTGYTYVKRIVAVKDNGDEVSTL